MWGLMIPHTVGGMKRGIIHITGFFFFFWGRAGQIPQAVWTGLNERRSKCLLILFWLGSEARVMTPMCGQGIFIVWPFLEVPREGRPGISYQTLAQRQGKSGRVRWNMKAVSSQMSKMDSDTLLNFTLEMLSKISWACLCEFISGFSLLFHWPMYLVICQ